MATKKGIQNPNRTLARRDIPDLPCKRDDVNVLQTLRFPILSWLLHRIILTATLILGLSAHPTPLYESRGFEALARTGLFFQGRLVWDANWYLSIARDGFTHISNSSGQRDTAFFPGFPLLIRVVDQLFENPFVSGLIVSELAFLLACIAVYLWAKKVTDQPWASEKALVLLLCFPSSFILGHIYTESLFLMTATFSFLYLREGRALLTGAFGWLTASTRVLGSFICLPIILVLFGKLRSKPIPYSRDIAALLIPLFALPMVMLYLWHVTGDPFAFSSSQFVPGWAGTEGWTSFVTWIKQAGSPPPFGPTPFWLRGYGLFCIALGLFISIWGLFRRAKLHPELLFSITTLLGSLVLWRSGGRFVVVLPALFLILAEKVSTLLVFGVIGPLLLITQIYFQDLFVHWVFVF